MLDDIKYSSPTSFRLLLLLLRLTVVVVLRAPVGQDVVAAGLGGLRDAVPRLAGVRGGVGLGDGLGLGVRRVRLVVDGHGRGHEAHLVHQRLLARRGHVVREEHERLGALRVAQGALRGRVARDGLGLGRPGRLVALEGVVAPPPPVALLEHLVQVRREVAVQIANLLVELLERVVNALTDRVPRARHRLVDLARDLVGVGGKSKRVMN